MNPADTTTPIAALLVGSRAAWLAKLRPKLESVNIDVRWHWEEKGDPRKGLPPGCDVMLITTDCNSHALSTSAVVLARTAGIPAIFLSHRWSDAATTLLKHGFKPISAAAVEVSPAVTAALTGATLPISTAIPFEVSVRNTVQKPSPEPAPLFGAAPTPPEPAPLPISPRVAKLPPSRRVVFDTVLRFLAADPWLTGADLTRLTNERRGYVDAAAAAARETLTIRASAGSGAAMIERRPTYEAWCRKLGVTPCPQDFGPSRPPYTAGNVGRASAASAKASAASAAVKAEAPPVTRIEVPPCVVLTGTPTLPSPLPPNDAVPAIPAEIREAVALLRSVMLDHGFAAVTVTSLGEIRWERRIVVEGAFTL